MEYVTKGYQPEAVFRFFEQISAIPRGSGNEKGISDFLADFARERGLWIYQDEMYNIIIKKEGQNGGKNAAPVMLQGHLDMVCEKLSGCPHDFEKDGLELQLKDGVLSANGTTLGADNGIAVAMMMALLEDTGSPLPPLECVFTVQEEVGLCGAFALDKSLLRARTMINLDSEEEGVATVSCAGGMRCELTRPLNRRTVEGTILELSVRGMLGGHSGTDIDKGRQNAVVQLARVASRLLEQDGVFLADFRGGSKDNAIPREADAVLLCTEQEDTVKNMAEEWAAILTAELGATEPDFRLEISTRQGKAEIMEKTDALALVRAIRLAPNGVLRRNMRQAGFVVTSVNLGIVSTKEDCVKLVFSPRSSVASLQEETVDLLRQAADTFGFDCECSGEYPGWEFAEVSPVREVFCAAYEELFGKPLKVEAIHAGLECGLFSDAMEGLDAIAVGPTIRECHTPQEYLPLDSVRRTFDLLLHVLERLAKREK